MAVLIVCRAGDFSFLRHLDAAKEDIDASISVFFNNSHVACFAEEANNFLMWSHYADRHRGVCLEFEMARRTDSECEIAMEIWGRPKSDADASSHHSIADVWRYNETVRKVDYVREIEPVSFLEFLPIFASEGDVDLHELSKSWWHPFADRLKSAFLQKSARWASERKWRIVDVKFKEANLPERRIYRYDIGALTGVIFGCRADDATESRIGRIVRVNSRDTILYDAQMSEEGRISIVEAGQYLDEEGD